MGALPDNRSQSPVHTDVSLGPDVVIAKIENGCHVSRPLTNSPYLLQTLRTFDVCQTTQAARREETALMCVTNGYQRFDLRVRNTAFAQYDTVLLAKKIRHGATLALYRYLDPRPDSAGSGERKLLPDDGTSEKMGEPKSPSFRQRQAPNPQERGAKRRRYPPGRSQEVPM